MSTEYGKEITWRSARRYSPVQDRTGIREPTAASFPPVTERVNQHPDPYATRFLDEREIMRATYQGDDRCQLACPGCYTGGRLRLPAAEVTASGGRKVTPQEEFTGHLDGLGTGMQDFYLLGAEATMDPQGSAAKLRYAAERGWPQQVITHGAVTVQRFEETFGAALDSGMVYLLVISLDSMDPQVDNLLRGRAYAHQRTVEIIRHCVRREAPVKVQMTVWPRNYTTIVWSVGRLYEMGVRAFSFHCGSLEGNGDFARHGVGHLDPLAWRALAEQLLAFRDARRTQLRHFNVPFLFFTETELREHVIGDDELTTRYLRHAGKAEAGEDTAKPVHACPALDVPQVYVYGNDGPHGRGMVSLCNIHADDAADGYADYDPASRRWQVRTDPRTNQLQHMIDSPHLCPATPYALRSATDRFVTEAGPLFHACRYIASNQMPVAADQFGTQVYIGACAYYAAIADALDRYPAPGPGGEWPIDRVRRVTRSIVPLAARAQALREDLRRAR